jgi:hypothetical protein
MDYTSVPGICFFTSNELAIKQARGQASYYLRNSLLGECSGAIVLTKNPVNDWAELGTGSEGLYSIAITRLVRIRITSPGLTVGNCLDHSSGRA